MSTPMEKIKAYHAMQAFLSEEQREEVAKMLNLTAVDLGRRMSGKEAEYEFLLRCYLLGELQDVIAFEEGVSRLTGTVTIDFLFITKSGKRLAIEVKSTEKNPWKIKKKVFDEKQKFARQMNAELYFAIRINQHWLLLSGDYVEEKNYKIDLAESLLDSEFHLLGERLYTIVDSQIKFSTTYTKNRDKSIGSKDEDYGYLERYILEIGNKIILDISLDSGDLFYIIMLHAIQEKASNHYKEIKSLGADRHLIIEELPRNIFLTLSDILVVPIRNLINDLNLIYDFSTYITEIVDEKDRVVANEGHAIEVLSLLSKSGVQIYENVYHHAIAFEDLYE